MANSQVVNSDVILTLPNGIVVRTPRDEDVASLARHGNNKHVWDNLRNRIPHPYTEADAKAWVDHCQSDLVRSGHWTLEGGSEGPPVPSNFFIIINGDAVGAIGLDFGTDVYRRTAELGYWLSEEHWGKGVMSHVVPAFVAWTWQTFGILIRLNAISHDLNVGSARVLQKGGFKEEGRRRDAFIKNGRVYNDIFWGALRPT